MWLGVSTSLFVWPHVNHDVGCWSKECLDCQHSRVKRHTSSPHSPFTPLCARFYLHSSQSSWSIACFQWLHALSLTVIDGFTRWPRVFPFTDFLTKILAQTFLQGWIAIGSPNTIIFDRSIQFQSYFGVILWLYLDHIVWEQLLSPTVKWTDWTLLSSHERSFYMSPASDLLDWNSAMGATS